MTDQTDDKFKKNLWKPGQSGNPQGRPKGSKNKATIIKQAIEEGMLENVEEDVKAVWRKAIDMALDGNETMIALVVNKFLSNAKGGDLDLSKGTGGIVINVSGIEKPAIDAEIIEED